MLAASKLQWMIDNCFIVQVTCNDHRCEGLTIEREAQRQFGRYERVDKDVLAEMIRRDRLVCVHVYPFTAVGCHEAIHWDLEAAIDMAYAAALKSINDARAKQTGGNQ